MKTKLNVLALCALVIAASAASVLAAGSSAITKNPDGSITLTQEGAETVARDIIRSRQMANEVEAENEKLRSYIDHLLAKKCV